MKKSLLIAGALVVVVLGAVAVGEAAGYQGGRNSESFGPGQGIMMGQGQGMMSRGQGMMGRGQGMMGRGQGIMGRGQGQGIMNGGTCQMADENFDPVALKTQIEARLEQQQAAVAALEAQLTTVTNETVKARLESRIEWQKIMIGHAEAHLAVLPTLTNADWVQNAIAMANADIEYFGKVTATDERNQAMVETRLAQAEARLEALEAQAAN